MPSGILAICHTPGSHSFFLLPSFFYSFSPSFIPSFIRSFLFSVMLAFFIFLKRNTTIHTGAPPIRLTQEVGATLGRHHRRPSCRPPEHPTTTNTASSPS